MSAEQAPRYVQRGQEQARTAWSWVGEVANKPFEDRYATLARKLPSYLQVSGLGQTMAFLYGKGKVGQPAKNKNDKDAKRERDAARELYKQLGGYLRQQLGASEDDVMEMIVKLSPGAYRHATRELMQVANWLKRFAEGRLGTADNNKDKD